MRVYIAGPMTGIAEHNYPAFYVAEDELRKMGHDPINPARDEGREGCSTWLDFMRAALRDLANADGVLLLDGWEQSAGASLEQRTAHDLGLLVGGMDGWRAASPSKAGGSPW